MTIKRIIKLGGEKHDYILKKNKLSKNVRLSVKTDASILVSAPRFVSLRRVEGFLLEHEMWLVRKIRYFKNLKKLKRFATGRDDYLDKKERAIVLVNKKLEQFNHFYGYKYSRISIRNQKTRWGSCSGKRNLNFNYRLVYLPEHLIDYVVVHELCHLEEMNHSKNFWALVSKQIPDYKKCRRELKREGVLLF